MSLGRTMTLIRTNIVADFPSRNGYIYTEPSLLDLVRMSGTVNGMSGKILDEFPSGDATFLFWLNSQVRYDFKLRGFELINKELAAIIDFGDDVPPGQFIAHPFVMSSDTIRTDKIISKIEKLVGIILVRS
jgi:hypothetical protein